ncbi:MULTISPECIES: ATP-dependent DNA helicase RecG [unclassified Lactococcus]|uniref:ATP-dependent DNA helicase RecG n=1 Tax=unclassified Lactococcus TaxID=2643510 RepID=UPI0011CA3F76|nr:MULTISPECIES: ATP-dependent DNA helicase RecG [unclassified Lactococcus]MQW23081.1 ATP-dependent DNA helicase RecG [Lactococcus sp. dk101]TXK44426.1 ATP-dependent DNA helicase RecG [Lactococcus sp. dk310]TXK50236.1 ATP-dependent DNA helicase RecG [Lactococcus sp. dk322]
MKLTDSIQFLKGVGPKAAENFHKLGIFTMQDLLLYFPFRYEDFASRSIFDLLDGEKATISGTVVTPANVQYYGFKRNRLTFKIKQDEAVVGISFFNQPYLADKVEVGSEIAVYGKWEQAKQQLSGMKIVASKTNTETDDDLGFEPVYHLVAGLKQSTLVKAIQQVLEAGLLNELSENLPQYLLEKYRLMGRQEAVQAMHFPKDMEAHKQALRRVKFEELFLFQLKLQALKNKDKVGQSGLQIDFEQAEVNAKMAELPYELTGAQSSALTEILADMASPYHMNRLLQGDVGSGKTVVASLAMYAACLANFQAAIMVPTEILARQHVVNLRQLFPELHITLLVSGLKTAEKRLALEDIASGKSHMIVGTHALIQNDVDYYRLGLVVTDEQHRFGVNQRKVFREKGQNPDVLMMTATPIPRTLAITAFGDMDVSIINELPKGRQPITTRWVKHEQFGEVLKWIKTELDNEAQVYFISPLIEESEALDLKNAVALYEELMDYFGLFAKIGLLHGKMKADEKDAVMQDFKAKKLDVLVSTTVIEVGVDVPNATIMVIMDADRFGLSQLHQLRGRVGRGSKKSFTILVANPKSDTGKKRMKIMTETQNGFTLAEEDLKMRGSGEIFGVRQSGIPEFIAADLVNDYNILEVARAEAVGIFKHSEDFKDLLDQIDVNGSFD